MTSKPTPESRGSERLTRALSLRDVVAQRYRALLNHISEFVLLAAEVRLICFCPFVHLKLPIFLVVP